ncbi:hypothetical protein [Streptomyces hygroscopicus]|uniref:hypothetical protein n=1 Tax=Streptomyces hygroscopicus TaxID=1912 RepID=UPI00082A7B4A|nr:hypothetical protein [Streptomyces hygroscopicus]GLV78025.1 hypothetical protein Shyhy02_60250 [Streptomyces hygroscopicus subsp. hygroscopicus]
MALTLALNYPAAIPAGHRIEVTEFADTRPEKKRYKTLTWADPCQYPAVLDLDTGIRYMSHVHASRGGNGGFMPHPYPLVPRNDLPVSRVYQAVVKACTLVMVDAFENQHTTLLVEPVE